MKFALMDPNVGYTMNVFLILGNIINIVYNIPQMVKTYKRKSTKDLSAVFLFLRIIGNTIWIAYAVEVDSLLMLINNIVTVLASIFISYYKVRELHQEYQSDAELLMEEDDIPLGVGVGVESATAF